MTTDDKFPMEKLGKTGEFPFGKVSPDDEGELEFAVGAKDGNVFLDFGTPVTWIGLPAQQAADLASLLLRHARLAARQSNHPITISI